MAFHSIIRIQVRKRMADYLDIYDSLFHFAYVEVSVVHFLQLPGTLGIISRL